LLKNWLAPPPVEPLPSFHASSLTYPMSFPEFEKVGVNCVPPTEVTLGSADISLMVGVLFAWQELSRPAAPWSPDETNTLCPCEAACMKMGSIVPSINEELGPQNE
jgi:hypothetical protein